MLFDKRNVFQMEVMHVAGSICDGLALKKKVCCQANTTRKSSESTKMPSRSSFAENLVLSTRPVHSEREIIVAEAVQDTASLK